MSMDDGIFEVSLLVEMHRQERPVDSGIADCSSSACTRLGHALRKLSWLD